MITLLSKNEIYFSFKFSGLLALAFILNIFSVNVIGYGAIYTGMIIVIISFIQLSKRYQKKFNKELVLPKSLIVSFIVFFISTLSLVLIADNYERGEVTYEYYRNGYFLYILEDVLKQSIPLSVFYSFIYVPIRRVIRLKINKTTEEENANQKKMEQTAIEIGKGFLNLFEYKWWLEKLKK